MDNSLAATIELDNDQEKDPVRTRIAIDYLLKDCERIIERWEAPSNNKSPSQNEIDWTLFASRARHVLCLLREEGDRLLQERNGVADQPTSENVLERVVAGQDANLRPITGDDMDHMSVDQNGRLYWHGRRLMTVDDLAILQAELQARDAQPRNHSAQMNSGDASAPSPSRPVATAQLSASLHRQPR